MKFVRSRAKSRAVSYNADVGAVVYYNVPTSLREKAGETKREQQNRFDFYSFSGHNAGLAWAIDRPGQAKT